jgi:hypothetical protein
METDMAKTRLSITLPLAALGLAALALPASADRGRYHDVSWRGGGQGVILHADAGFHGDGLRIRGAEPDLARLRFNDRASSISISNGVWELCTDAHFRGRCEIVDASTPRLNAYRLNDNVSSLRPVAHRDRPGRGGWGRRGGDLVLFQDSAQRGQAIEISHDVADLSQYRFNDRASSFLVTGGTWLVCEHANYRGRCEVLTGGAGDLKPIRMNDNISSIRAYDGWR